MNELEPYESQLQREAKLVTREPFVVCYWPKVEPLQVISSAGVEVAYEPYGFIISCPNEHGWCQWNITVLYSHELLGQMHYSVTLHGYDVKMISRVGVCYESSLPWRIYDAIRSVTSHWSPAHRFNKSVGADLFIRAYADWAGSQDV